MHIPQIEAVKPAFVTNYLDEDPITIAYSEEDTQPLPSLRQRKEEKWFCAAILLFCLSFCGVAIFFALTYPAVTIDVMPVEKTLITTTTLPVATRTLLPATLTKSLTTNTTGRGHMDAARASGMLTLYNGQFQAVTIPQGSLFLGSDGVKVATDATVTIPPANPPYFGQVFVPAHAIQAGKAGNIQAGDLNTVCCAPSVLVKNPSVFSGGRDARDFQAVSQRDIDRVSLQLKAVLSQQIEVAFSIQPNEGLFLSNCAFKITPNHQPGEEAQLVTVTVSHTCQGTAYPLQTLQAQATDAAESLERASLGSAYLLVGEVQTSVTSVSPFLVKCTSLWAYNLTTLKKQSLIQTIAGKSPEQAKLLLLHTGVIQQVNITAKNALPLDPDYIHIRVLIG